MSTSSGEAPVLAAADYAVFCVMLAVSAAIGVYYGFFARSTSADDYLVGGRTMGTLPVSMSLIASFISGIMLLGIATESYLYGMQYAYIFLAVILCGVITAFAFLPVFHDLGITSTYEYLDMRYGRSARLLGSFFFTIYTLVWIPIVIYVPAAAFNQEHEPVFDENAQPDIYNLLTFDYYTSPPAAAAQPQPEMVHHLSTCKVLLFATTYNVTACGSKRVNIGLAPDKDFDVVI